MRIGFDVSALVKEAAGIGQWIIHTLKNIMEIDKERNLNNEYYLFTYDDLKSPLELPPNWHMVYYGGDNRKQLRYLTHAHRYIKEQKLDVFVGTRHYLPLFKGKTKYVGIVHDLIPLYMPELFTKEHKLRFKTFTTICKYRADAIVAVSEATKADVLKYMKLPSDKVKVIYEGANPMFNAERDTAGIKATMEKYHIDSDYVLCLSTVEPRKNMLRTIQAYEQCILEAKLPYKLVIVGGSGWNNGPVYEYVQEHLELKKHVIFTGYVSDLEVKHIYSNASLFIYASLCEGFGLPILEAMQSGIPVITSNLSSMPEVAGEACELIDPYDISQMKDAMTKVLSSKELQESMAQAGLQQAKKFSWRKSAEETLDFIMHVGHNAL